jgi:hypothetical protein
LKEQELSTVIIKENNRGSEANAQSARQAMASGSRLGLEPAIAIATDVVLSSKDVLVNLSAKRPRRRLDPEPDRQPEPVKMTRKRRAVNDVEEVDLGSRKHQSRK